MSCTSYPSPAWCWWGNASSGQQLCVAIGGTCSILAAVLSVALFVRHVRSSEPSVIKTSILRIIALVPLFSLHSFVGLVDPDSPLFIETLLAFAREMYEGVVLVAFVHFVVNTLDGPHQIAAKFSDKMQVPQHPFVMKVIPTPFPPGLRFISMMLWGVLQFAAAMFIVTGISIIIWIVGIALDVDHGTLATLELFPKGIKSLSSMYAMYILTVFYFEILRNEDLKDKFEAAKPELKFLCLKGVIVLPMMQDFVISFLANQGFFDSVEWVSDNGQVSAEAAGAGIQSFVVSIEMLLFSLLYWFAYPSGSGEAPAVRGANGLRGMFEEVKLVSEKATMQRRMIRKLATKSVADEEVTRTFHAITTCDRDTIGEHEFRYVLVCASLKRETIEQLVNKGDANRDKRITLTEFKAAFTASPSGTEGMPSV